MSAERGNHLVRKGNERALWLVEITLALILIVIIAGVAMPSYTAHKKAKLHSELNSGLYEIQQGLERFAVDHGKTYPDYLIGGSAPDFSGDFGNSSPQASDVLLREGYLQEYPPNPFMVTQQVEEMQEEFSDLFRPGTAQSMYGCRFGDDYDLMGQVMADFRFPKLEGQKPITKDGMTYYDDVQYPCFNLWMLETKRFFPGEFFYKSAGSIMLSKLYKPNPNQPLVAAKSEVYVLGVYGGPRDKGMDVLGWEPQVAFRTKKANSEQPAEFKLPLWTRSSMRTFGEGKYVYSGSPFGEPREYIDYGFRLISFDGQQDGVITTMQPEPIITAFISDGTKK